MDILLTSSDQPLYKQIADQIKTQILTEQLPVNFHLPSIRMLARDLQISVITTKKAYELLEKEGLIQTIPAKGMYVSAKNTALIREMQKNELEQAIANIINKSLEMGMSKSELLELVTLLQKEE